MCSIALSSSCCPRATCMSCWLQAARSRHSSALLDPGCADALDQASWLHFTPSGPSSPNSWTSSVARVRIYQKASLPGMAGSRAFLFIASVHQPAGPSLHPSAPRRALIAGRRQVGPHIRPLRDDHRGLSALGWPPVALEASWLEAQCSSGEG